ncbi:SET domain-containing protein [Methyloceanibacter sp.]|uniref:SET domain-containing protein n=1 Tax=Methyloceanibacter sp. TaxID=1965321 RepID=UPI002D311DD0|nr:SET domain-containing protein [Methyloceanibacter sp.]HZP09285.1 SET domain-containing protein [Methyloceanibacter sp.]
MLLIGTYLAPSSIEGIGVFAAEPIARGRLMWSLNPKFDVFVHPHEIEGLPPHMQDYVARYSYPHLEMPGVVILDSDNGRFMNHSLEPNTDFRIFDKGYALVDIAVGEELTCNYHEFDPSFTGFFSVAPVKASGRRARANGSARR